MSVKRRFIIGEQEYYVSKEDILSSFKDRKPKLPRKYYVEVAGKKVGLKEAIYKTIDVPKDSFATNSAKSILKKLGFEVKEVEETTTT